MLQPKLSNVSVESMSVADTCSELEKLEKYNSNDFQPKMQLTWHDITVSDASDAKSTSSGSIFGSCCPPKVSDLEKMPEEKRILDNAFGVARPGEVTAIIGPSGAGKTTLLNVLTKRNLADLATSGSVKRETIRKKVSARRYDNSENNLLFIVNN
uniref:ABC transporter domain-containing protein n=1 Tax=Caenorhabditis japonica TaxID=281687 RepID=A0A8R1HHH5_CAEJA